MIKSAIPKVIVIIIAIALAYSAASLALSRRQNMREQMRATALPVTVKQAQPIIQAIESYRIANRAIPATLSALVPKYLQQIPNAGPAAKKGWKYRVDTKLESGGWSLSIEVRDEFSPNVVGFGDTFVFHPSGKYPNAAYGGGLRRFGKWGYYVE